MEPPSKRSGNPGETPRISERFKRLAIPVTGISQMTKIRLMRVLIRQNKSDGREYNIS